MNTKLKLFFYAAAAIVPLGAILIVASSLRVKDGVWLFDSAPTPEGWPPPTPVGVVQVKEYPAHRAAEVVRSGLAGGQRPMFMELFDHIQTNDISMTAPVEMRGNLDSGRDMDLDAMAFYYRSQAQGSVSDQGAVSVRDRGPQLHATVGVRGGYHAKTFERGRQALASWLEAEGDEWEVAGEYRYLGYNGPFVPPFWRYGEVQVPIRPRTTDAARAR